MLSAVQFLRLAERYHNLPPAVRAAAAAMAEGDSAAAESAAGGRGSPDWWTAEFFVVQLADHGIAAARPRSNAAPSGARLFAD